MVQVIANGATSCDMFRLSRFVQLSLKEQTVINYWIALQKDREKNKSLNLFLNILLCSSWIIYSLVIHNWRLRLLFKHRHISVLLFELLNKNWISGATPRQLSMGGTFNIEWKEIGWIPRLRMFEKTPQYLIPVRIHLTVPFREQHLWELIKLWWRHQVNITNVTIFPNFYGNNKLIQLAHMACTYRQSSKT